MNAKKQRLQRTLRIRRRKIATFLRMQKMQKNAKKEKNVEKSKNAKIAKTAKDDNKAKNA